MAGRIFEHTDDQIALQFRRPDQLPDLEKLIRLPTLFARESERGVNNPAHVGTITAARFAGRDVHIEYVFDTSIPPVPSDILRENAAELGLSGSQFSRTHWCVLEGDLYKFLARHSRPSRRLPTVFSVSQPERINQNFCSAMMPFSTPFTPVYRKLQEVAQGLGMDCRRADDIWENNTIIQDVVSLIDRSCAVICDCTDRNPNVFYEIGVAHALGREVVLITQSHDDVPFDLRHLRYIHYLNNSEGLEALARNLTPRLADLRTRA